MKTKIIVILLSLLFSSCENWLSVSADSEITSEQQFADQQGFKDATIGIYINMARPELYAKTLSWHFVEFLSQQYAVVSGASTVNIPRYAYEDLSVKPYQLSIWLNSYNLISNINNILENIDQKREILHPAYYNMIKGEMLALRAMIHFDLMRLYGLGNLAPRPEIQDRYAIPYKTTYHKGKTPQMTYRETLKKMTKDLTDAIQLLEMDPIAKKYPEEFYSQIVNEPFFKNRKLRMNYYAAKALLARVAMWQGTSEMRKIALEESKFIIENAPYAWSNEFTVTSPEDANKNLLFVTEQLFTLNVTGLINIFGTWLQAHSPGNMYSVVYMTKERAFEVYEVDQGIGLSDWRFVHCLRPEGTTLSNYALLKLRQYENQNEAYSNRLPMIRITEMFYIAAECSAMNGDVEKAVTYLNTVRSKRNITSTLDTEMSYEKFQKELTKEYMKEFLGEGQLFYYYKRLGMESIMGRSDAMSDLEYRFPYPDEEKISGGIIN